MTFLALLRDAYRGLIGKPPSAAEIDAEIREGQLRDLDLDFAYNPHRDTLVLHAPGECQFCDLYPRRQRTRQRARVRFTGEPPEIYPYETAPCPAEMVRPLDEIEATPGNRARR